MSPDEGFPTFSKFIQSVQDATHVEHVSRPASKVREAGDFDQMKQHVLNLYAGVEVQHSFVDDQGQVFDCVPIEQQPSLKGQPPANAPTPPQTEGGGEPEGGAQPVGPHLQPEHRDRFGHAMTCPPGTIPMRRVTLDELSKYERLSDFFQKTPWGGRHPRLGGDEEPLGRMGITPGVHKYAHAYQVADNLGGASTLGVWAPGVGSQIFSLSQQWYAGGSPVQTVEIGWQVYPGKYNTTAPCLFIYWTADGYQHTGSYNLDSPGFVQTSTRYRLGGALSPVSVWGGAQYELELHAFLYQGNWWLYVGGGSYQQTIGYYPASLYGAGTLATHASDVDFGGEVVDQTSWPPMGSGSFANTGWTHAAYHRDIQQYPTSGGGVQASLTASQPSPDCFTIEVAHANAPWNEYFWFGGPGGAGCS
jgi:hypothetical protein